MVRLTRINGRKVYVNPLSISTVEESTTSGKAQSEVWMDNGRQIEALETVDEILRQIPDHG